MANVEIRTFRRGILKGRGLLIIPGIIALLSLALYTLWYVAADTIFVGETSHANKIIRGPILDTDTSSSVKNIAASNVTITTNNNNNQKELSSSPVKLWLFSVDGRTDITKSGFIKQAVLSAKQKTSLIPVLLMENQNAELEEWIQSSGGGYIVHISDRIHKSKLLEIVATNKDFDQNPVSWHKLILPQIIAECRDQLVQADKRIKSEDFKYVLYTDTNVVFLKSFDIEPRQLPRYIGVAVQGSYISSTYDGNAAKGTAATVDRFSREIQSSTGVLIVNITGYAEAQKEFHAFLVSKANEYNPTTRKDKRGGGGGGQRTRYNDHEALHDFFPLRFDKLSLIDYASLLFYHGKYFSSLRTKYYATRLSKKFDWEPVLGVNKDAVLLHWDQGSGLRVNDIETCEEYARMVVSRKGIKPLFDPVQYFAPANANSNSNNRTSTATATITTTASSSSGAVTSSIGGTGTSTTKQQHQFIIVDDHNVMKTATSREGYSFAIDLFVHYMDIACTSKH